jgi:phosphatidate cytidylyltransferase
MYNETIKRILTSIILIPLLFFFIIKGSYYFNFLICLSLVIATYEWYQMNDKKNYFFYGTVFLIFSFYTAYYLRNFDQNDYTIFLIVIITCMSTDIGGYIFGKTFKGPKLTKISPNKTYAGVFGGFFLTIVFTNLFLNNREFLGLGDNLEITTEFFLIVIAISFISQMGDLIISYFKRRSKIKNIGKLIPGHGGLLDRIDGMIFAFPFMYLILQIF